MIGRRLGAVGALAALLLATPVMATDWVPTKQVRIIAPAAPGGLTDILSRMLANHLQQQWGQPVVVENRSGGGGTIGAALVAQSAPDGHVGLMGNFGPNAVAYTLFRNMPYRPENLAPVSNILIGPNVLVVNPRVPARNLAEFIAYARANPGSLNYGSSGVGQSPHLGAVWFLQLVGSRATHVPYRGAAPAMLGLINGDIQFMFDNLSTELPAIRDGRVRALAVTTATRSPHLPDVPSVREGAPELANYDLPFFFGFFVAGETPRAIVEAWNRQIRTFVDLPETQARFNDLAGTGAWDTPEAFKIFVDGQIARWREVISREGLTLEIE